MKGRIMVGPIKDNSNEEALPFLKMLCALRVCNEECLCLLCVCG